MKRLLAIACCVGLTIGSVTAEAAVFERDWKAPGDGLLTYDDVNQRVWLDLTETRLSNYPGPTFFEIEERYQNPLADLAPGGQFEGFTVAKSDDLTALVISAGINVSSLDDYAHNDLPTRQLMELVGVSVHFENISLTQSYGVLDHIDMEGSRIFRRVGMLTSDPVSGPNGQAGLIFTAAGDLIEPNNTGVWLYRPVPEPSGLGMGFFLSVPFLLVRASRRLR